MPMVVGAIRRGKYGHYGDLRSHFGRQAAVLTMAAQRMFAGATSFTLLAVPFFILAGQLMNTAVLLTGFRFARAMSGHLWGGLAR